MTTRKSKKPVVPDTRAGFTNPDEPLGLVETEMADLVKNGPFSVLYTSQKENTQVLINVRNNKKLLGRVKAFDRHMNMILENVKEMWVEYPKSAQGGNARPVNRDRYISRMFLRGDSVILILRNPN
mmetsp:Transcript_14165/g.29000  ORF Transcript_14165/g.29000 Transcript_14165/m.29000 type:complete len:126 (-) Transcript_14165:341-718(-)